MKNLIFLFLLLVSTACFGQFEKYLAENRQDLTQNSFIDMRNARLIGFGALHGSAETETTELILLNQVVPRKRVKYYFPETDFSTANYFREYVNIGNEELLKELIYEYGLRVPQERSIELFNKWKKLRPLFKKYDVQVIGTDKIASYKFSVIELLQLTRGNNPYLDSMQRLVDNEKTDWAAYYTTDAQNLLRRFVAHLEENRTSYRANVSDTFAFDHIIRNIKLTFENSGREQVIYDNYKLLSKRFVRNDYRQFFRFGIFHLMKSKINGASPFFARLIENNDYAPSEILTIQGFLTKSKVLWDVTFDKQGNYTGYITKSGYGISDYCLEHFKGIKWLKRNKLSGITLFDLSEKGSPYREAGRLDLIRIKKLFGRSPWNPAKNKSTTDYIDYAVLISGSEAGRPIEELR